MGKDLCDICGQELCYSTEIQEYVCPDCEYGIGNRKIIDISFKKKDLAKSLSNLCNYPFVIDGVKCYSMESFIQSLRVKDIDVRHEVCSKTSVFNYSIRSVLGNWQDDGLVYWDKLPSNGTSLGTSIAIDRFSEDYSILLMKAYCNMYEQNALFRHALELSKDYALIHSIGRKKKEETLLTESEYIHLLNILRFKYKIITLT